MESLRKHLSYIFLHVEYAERRKKYGILFIFSLFREYIDIEYARVPVTYRVHQAEYIIHIRVAASQEYENTYSTRRVAHRCTSWTSPVRVKTRVWPSYVLNTYSRIPVAQPKEYEERIPPG